MPEKYHIEDLSNLKLVDDRIQLREGEKTPEQLRQQFYEKWEDSYVNAFPLLQEGESQAQLLEKHELYQRPHAEIYSVTVEAPRINREWNGITTDTSHIGFMIDAKTAGFRIENVIAVDTSPPWFRRVLRRMPRETTVTFVLIAPPRQVPK